MTDNTITDNDINTLIEFLHYPLGSADAVFQRFNTIPNPSKMLRGNSPDRFIYLPGTRRNKVLLVAHADTAWNEEDHIHTVIREGNILRSSNPATGLGADDRAGCAIIWLLKDLGHSILITDGEEELGRGSGYLMYDYQPIADEIQFDHQFVIQFDRCNGREFKCYDVGSDSFRSYIAAETGYTEPNRKSTTDIVRLCKDIAGVNLSCGYRDEHKATEHLHIDEWLNTLNICRNWLAKENLPRFMI